MVLSELMVSLVFGELAVLAGFEGDEPDFRLWASLKGEDGVIGVDGKSAYEIAVDDGFVGTEWANLTERYIGTGLSLLKDITIRSPIFQQKVMYLVIVTLLVTRNQSHVIWERPGDTTFQLTAGVLTEIGFGL